MITKIVNFINSRFVLINETWLKPAMSHSLLSVKEQPRMGVPTPVPGSGHWSVVYVSMKVVCFSTSWCFIEWKLRIQDALWKQTGCSCWHLPIYPTRAAKECLDLVSTRIGHQFSTVHSTLGLDPTERLSKCGELCSWIVACVTSTDRARLQMVS